MLCRKLISCCVYVTRSLTFSSSFNLYRPSFSFLDTEPVVTNTPRIEQVTSVDVSIYYYIHVINICAAVLRVGAVTCAYK